MGGGGDGAIDAGAVFLILAVLTPLSPVMIFGGENQTVG